MTSHNLVHISLAVVAGLLVSEFTVAVRPVQLGLGLFTLIAWLWISEAVHISVTALAVPIIATLTGIFSVKESLINFANPVIFLFMGGFALAAALQKYELDRMFAVKILALSRGIPLLAILLLFLVTAFLSMWISNTAAVAMMLPLALGLLTHRDPVKDSKLFLFVLLGLAYSGNLGGMATLIGSPPNAIAASAVGIDFSTWLSFGVPVFLLLFPLMVIVLLLYIRPAFGSALLIEEAKKLADPKRKWVLLIFF
ncbi:MAG: anion permease [Pseudomonadales bacterium]|nr:anion permease [Pseudomonadales bacterium]